MFPIVAAAGGLLANVLVVSKAVESVTVNLENVSNMEKNVFSENYMTKRLSLELSKNYTTGLKDVNGSVIPQGFNQERLEQIERLIQATLNQGKFR